MDSNSIVESVKENVAGARVKARRVVAHGQEVVKTGKQTLQAARDVVVDGGREVLQVATHTKDELKRTLKEGASQVGERLARIATPTHKEQAIDRKAAIKAKKRRKREEAMREAEDPDPAPAEG